MWGGEGGWWWKGGVGLGSGEERSDRYSVLHPYHDKIKYYIHTHSGQQHFPLSYSMGNKNHSRTRSMARVVGGGGDQIY